MSRRPLAAPPRRRNRWLVWLVVLIWIALGTVLIYQFYLRPLLREKVRETVRQQLGQPVASSPAITSQPGATVRPAQPDAPANPPIDVGGAVAALPVGEFTLTEQQVNAYITPRLASLKPLDRLTVRFVPGEVQLQLGAYGLSSTARLGLAVQQGRVLVVNPRLEGPLAGVLDLKDLVDPLQQALNQQLDAQGRAVNEVSIGNGTITVRVDQ